MGSGVKNWFESCRVRVAGWLGEIHQGVREASVGEPSHRWRDSARDGGRRRHVAEGRWSRPLSSPLARCERDGLPTWTPLIRLMGFNSLHHTWPDLPLSANYTARLLRPRESN